MKSSLSAVMCFMVALSAFAGWEITTVSAAQRPATTNGTATSSAVQQSLGYGVGEYGVQTLVGTTTGSIQRVYLEASNDGVTYGAPVGMDDIFTNLVAGTYYKNIGTVNARYIRLKTVSTNDAVAITHQVISR